MSETKPCMYWCDELLMRLLKCYFGIYFPRCCETREINNKITLSWAHKQFTTWPGTLSSLRKWLWSSSIYGTDVKIHKYKFACCLNLVILGNNVCACHVSIYHSVLKTKCCKSRSHCLTCHCPSKLIHNKAVSDIIIWRIGESTYRITFTGSFHQSLIRYDIIE